ncbi:MAG: amino acid permease [Candidatus Heimdallarchaeota archaeon]|nr:amino acid permease [Candidatus Heimdallarchaeota archaeon]
MPNKDDQVAKKKITKESSETLEESIVPVEKVETGIVSQRELSRELGFKEALSIGLGGTIGGGVFSVLGVVAGIAGPAAILSFAFGGLLGLLIGYSYSKLALRYPSAGGSYAFCKAAFGQYVGGFFGWLLWIGYLASCALYAYTFGIYFTHMILPEGSAAWLIKLVQSILSTVLIALSTAINLKGVKETGRSQNIIVLIKVIILVFFVAITIPVAIKKAPENLVPFFPDEEGNPNNLFLGLALTIVGTSILFVAFEGLELIPNASEEIEEPQKNIPRSIFATVLIATAIYLLVAFAALGGTNYTSFTGENAKDAEYALAIAAQPILGLAGKIIIIFGALFSTASAFNASLYGSSRLTYVMARESIFPHFFQRVSKKNRIPFVSILVISGITLLITLTLNLQQIAELASTIFLLLFATVSLSSLILRKEIKANFLLPLLALLLSAGCFGLFLWHLISGMQDTGEGWLTLILLPVVILIAIVGSVITITLQKRGKKGRERN